jgi:hypothetical protein
MSVLDWLSLTLELQDNFNNKKRNRMKALSDVHHLNWFQAKN